MLSLEKLRPFGAVLRGVDLALLLWDATRYRRIMHRTTVAGEGPIAADGKPL